MPTQRSHCAQQGGRLCQCQKIVGTCSYVQLTPSPGPSDQVPFSLVWLFSLVHPAGLMSSATLLGTNVVDLLEDCEFRFNKCLQNDYFATWTPKTRTP